MNRAGPDADDVGIAVFLAAGGGPAGPGRPVPAAALDWYTGGAPDVLLRLWRRFGWSGFDRGRLWLTDPSEWAGVLGEWLDGLQLPVHDTFHVFARDAFGAVEA